MSEPIKLYLPGRGDPRICVIGGGHGLSTMLRGLKRVSRNITAIVTVADDGGGSGMLRDDLGMLPPGDIRNCILALANTEPIMERLLDYRFQEGSLKGQSFGNLFLAALNGISNSFDQAVRTMGEVLSIAGKVLPVSNENIYLEAEFENGSSVIGESKIFAAKKENDCRIRRIRLIPEHPRALPESLQALREADLIVLGPGSLYTSVIPNLLVDGVAEAIMQSKATKVYIMNIMTQQGETEEYSAADHVQELFRHADGQIFDYCIVNTQPVSEAVREAYRAEDTDQLFALEGELETLGVQTIRAELLAEGTLARHDPERLAQTLMQLLVTKAR